MPDSTNNVRNYLELQPVLPIGEWWQLLLVSLACLLLATFVIWIIRRDSLSLPWPLTTLLIGLRLCAIICIVAYLLNPGLRSESRVLTNSRLAVLVDTSLSMSLRDPLGNGSTSQPRIDDAIQWLDSDPAASELEALRKDHDISVYRFGDTAQPELIAALDKLDDETQPTMAPADPTKQGRWLGLWGIAGLVVAVVFIIGSILLSFGRKPTTSQDDMVGSHQVKTTRSSIWLALGVAMLVTGILLTGLADLQQPETPFLDSLSRLARNDSPSDGVVLPSPIDASTVSDEPSTPTDVDWPQMLQPSGTSTSLGSAIQFIVNKERGGPLAGIVIFSDGQSNAGAPVNVALTAASNANVPIFPVGLGTVQDLLNVAVADVQAPPRVLPGDRFNIKSVLKANGMAGRSVNVKIVSVDVEESEAEQLEAETTITLGADGEPVPFEVEVQSGEEGKRRFTIRTEVPDEDVDATDNQQSIEVEVVRRQTKVLLIAGGPNREFRFLRNQLYRDSDVELHVWLQSAKQGADQESDELLTEFPDSDETLFYYDCIIAFDADWRMLSQEQAEWLERWVAEKAGGLVLVAGPVNTPEWTRRPRGDEAIDIVRQLYPVSFFSQGTAQLKLGRFGGREAFPIAFSREGRAARFLWLGESAVDSASTWSQFDGVFGYYAVNETKSGADVLATFADPSTSIDGELPIYMASQFYGAGRVFFQASAEMWRVRTVDVDYFQDYYTQLIRWSSQGRLLRDSNRGVLLVDREQCWLGDQVSVQAILRDAADQPLMMDSVSATLARPDGTTQRIDLVASQDAIRPGTFDARFATTIEGDYRITLPLPTSAEATTLNASVRASIPDLEKATPKRNDLLLQEIADKTQGHYYIGATSFVSRDGNAFSPTQLIGAQDQESFLTGSLNRFFQRKLMMWLLTWLTLCLALEWTVRRTHRLS